MPPVGAFDLDDTIVVVVPPAALETEVGLAVD